MGTLAAAIPTWFAAAAAAAHTAVSTIGPSAAIAGAHEAAHAAIGTTLLKTAAAASAAAVGHTLTLANVASGITAANGIQTLLAPRPKAIGAPPALDSIGSAMASRRFAAAAAASPLGGTFNNIQGSPQIAPAKSLLGQ